MFKLIRKVLLAIGVLTLSHRVSAQTNLQYPLTFSQFFNYYSFLNPAATGLKPKVSLTLGNQFNTGYYSRIRNYYVIGEYSTLDDEKRISHAVGAVFLGNQEGELLSISRGFLQYALHVALTERWKLSAGAALGGLSFQAEQTSTSGKVTSLAYDGSVGLFLHSATDQLGISSSQIFNHSLQVITERVPLKRYFRLIYSRNQYLSESIRFVPAVLLTFKKEINEIEVAPAFLIKETIHIGLSYRYPKGSAYFFGIKNIETAGIISDLTFSYNSPWPAKNLASINSFELVLSLTYK